MNLLFTDEFRFRLIRDSRRTVIWREHGIRFYPTIIVGKRPFRGDRVLVWAGIMFDGHTDLHIFDGGTVNIWRYKDEIPELYVRLFRGAVGPHLIFMDDNACPIRTHLLDDYLEREDIQHMDWPAMSSNMNPIEHAWDALGRRVATHQHPPRTLPDLQNALCEEWEQLLAEFFNHFVESMPSCCEACAAMRGDYISY